MTIKVVNTNVSSYLLIQTAASTSNVEYVQKHSAQYAKTFLKKALSEICTILQVMKSMGLNQS